jgi:hypothetical protein
MLPEDTSEVICIQRQCNWLQGLEGDIDTSHLGFLHMGAVSPDEVDPGTFSEYVLRERAPKYKTIRAEYGTTYGAYRPASQDTYYWRIAHFLFPFYTMPPVGLLGRSVVVRAWVPLDDEHTMFMMMRPKSGVPPQEEFGEYLPNTSASLGRWRLKANSDNDYMIDREEQRIASYSGIKGNYLQDQAITESMGPIVDRRLEHLGSSDEMIILTRKRLLEAGKLLRTQNIAPPGVDRPEIYEVRAGGVVLPRSDDWLADTEGLRKAWLVHPELDDGLMGTLMSPQSGAASIVTLIVDVSEWKAQQTVSATTEYVLMHAKGGGARGRIVYRVRSVEDAQVLSASMSKAIEGSRTLYGQVRSDGVNHWSALHGTGRSEGRIVRVHYEIAVAAE